jgi:hypothetical protein
MFMQQGHRQIQFSESIAVIKQQDGAFSVELFTSAVQIILIWITFVLPCYYLSLWLF